MAALTALTGDPILLWLCAYWDGCRSARALPTRADRARIGQTYVGMGDGHGEAMISILHQKHSMDELRREVLRVEP